MGQAEILSGTKAKEALVDLGYRGREVPGVTNTRYGQKRGINTRQLKKALKRRNAINPVIGHIKTTDYREETALKVNSAMP